ncbi:restriction endonuclease subunit S (plasmid) [Fusobacteria bacterium ZRK30]|nr:restriction endonuclease subunit S [Fusobacteria bacterium ZRK30]
MKKLQPELRFKEFSGDWEEKKLGEVSKNTMYGMNSSAIKYDGKHKYIRITDINENSRKFSPRPLSSPDGNIEEKFKLIENDILFTRTGASVGKTYIYNKEDGDLYFAGFLIKFNIDKANSKFIFNSTLKEKYNKWVSIMSMRSGQPGINAEEYKSLRLNLPTISEQEKIANFLSSMDEKIQKLEGKKEKLGEYKKGIMQKVFSQEIRFKDEDGQSFPDWEEKKLGEIAHIKRGASPRPITDPKWFSDKKEVGWVRISDVSKSNKYLKETLQYLSDEGIKKSRYIEPENMIMSICATIGKPIYTTFPVCIHDGFIVFDKLQSNKEYLYYFLQMIQKRWYRYGQPGTQVNLNSDIVSSEKIPYPCLEEQEKIADFLSSMDEKIEKVKGEIDRMEEFKKGLLQGMFV